MSSEFDITQEAYRNSIKNMSQSLVDLAVNISSRDDIPTGTRTKLIRMVLDSQKNLKTVIEKEEEFFRAGIAFAALFAIDLEV